MRYFNLGGYVLEFEVMYIKNRPALKYSNWSHLFANV